MFGRTAREILAVLGAIREELRRIRIAQEECLDVWRAVGNVTDPLGEIEPSEIADGDETPLHKRRVNHGN